MLCFVFEKIIVWVVILLLICTFLLLSELSTFSDGVTILKAGGPKSIQFFHLQCITRSYKLTVIFVVLALATANTACR